MTAATGSELARNTLTRLKHRIASGEWPIGTRIPTEQELATQLAVGRSTVREAIRSLATLGMVETLTARGTFVRASSPSVSLLLEALAPYLPEDLASFRRAIDVEAAQMAAVRHTEATLAEIAATIEDRDSGGTHAVHKCCPAFHTAVARASANPLLIELDERLSGMFENSGLDVRICAALEGDTASSEHRNILAAIQSRNVSAAAHQTALHADRILRSLGEELVATDLTTLSDRYATDATTAIAPQLGAH